MGNSLPRIISSAGQFGRLDTIDVATFPSNAADPNPRSRRLLPFDAGALIAPTLEARLKIAASAASLTREILEHSIPSTQNAYWNATSIFSGCGGLDLGFLQHGICTQAAFDLDRKAIATYNRNFGPLAHLRDLSHWSPTDNKADLLLAGAPCQGFSTAGKRKLDDPRNELLSRVGDIAVSGKYKALVVENVPAAATGFHKELWISLEDHLRWYGYNVRRVTIEAHHCGLVQNRKRLFLICWKGSDCINIDIEKSQPRTLAQTLSNIESAIGHEPKLLQTGSRDWLISQKIQPGQKLSNVRLSERAVPTWAIPEVYGQTTPSERELLDAVVKLRRRERIRSFGDGDPVHLSRLRSELGRDVEGDVARLVRGNFLKRHEDSVELRQTYNGRYRRLSWDRLSPTVDTRFGRPDLFLHPAEHRGMTSREAARIQGFPDEFQFLGTEKDQFTQIGNAVPPPMAGAIARFLREAILKA